MVRVLETTQADASAILEHRNHEGALASMDDRSKVPGIDAADVGRQVDRMAFTDRQRGEPVHGRSVPAADGSGS
jgi:hypothetical protein